MKLTEPASTIVAILIKHGYRPEITRNAHYKIRAEGLPLITVAASQSDFRGARNAIATAKRLIRAAGEAK